ncbi:hypothetical protein KC909_03780 [Candidatus Dojkabacteria bacterium]|uniref:DUF948 domain-containing protein n=1 Tax=Candidatus Dojkabacteria bacterium TaxID=2099670 RepID=A0A955RJJ7_9BACT|nr:hypothetical protein [Candidatus Dojkabacteria bacterium]
MNIDDFVKILLVVSISFSIVGISYQIMRVLGGMADSIKDFRKTIQNTGTITDKVLADYDFVSDQIKGFASSVGRIGSNVIDPVVNLLSFLERFKSPSSDYED